MIADYVPAKPELVAPAQTQGKMCEACGHEILGFRHVELTGYGDPARWCDGCAACHLMRCNRQP